MCLKLMDSDKQMSLIQMNFGECVQVEGTDRGTQIGDAEKRAIDEIVNKLETLCMPEPLSSPLLFGGQLAPRPPVP